MCSRLYKFSGDDNRSTWEHINQYVAQLGEAGSSNALRIRLFSLSLTRTIFSWFSSLPPNSVHSCEENKAKLTYLTSVKQGSDKSITNYFRRFKDIKN